MKTLIIGNADRYLLYLPKDMPFAVNAEKVFCSPAMSAEEILKKGGDADFLATDPMAHVSGDLIRSMPNLKVIHSEGVGFNGIDLEAAAERNIPVCNCRGVNAGAVAEQAILLMLGFLRHVREGDRIEREGKQMQMKEQVMVHALREISDCKIGLIGFGDIGQATAERLYPFGGKLYYYSRHRRDAETEKKYHVEYLPLQELAASCDIISLHLAVAEETVNLVDKEFISRMKPDAFLVNTARGELIDNEALKSAIIEGKILGAALDTIAPEPTKLDNPLLNLPEECADRILFSPHIGGITIGAMKRAHRILWTAFEDVSNGKRPSNIVNAVS